MQMTQVVTLQILQWIIFDNQAFSLEIWVAMIPSGPKGPHR